MSSKKHSIQGFDRKIYLHGVAGTGKTTLATERLRYLLTETEEPEGVLVLIPQRTLGAPFSKVLTEIKEPFSQELSVMTMSGLVRRMVHLFWPLVGNEAGFHQSHKQPRFLTLETSQYYMNRLLDPFLAKGFFSTVRLTRNRLLGQLIDNLNKSAIIGFPYTEICERLIGSWIGEESQIRVYADAQELINTFRAFCLENNLLDYSLQVEMFKEFIWPNKLVQNYLHKLYPHVIYDNAEEDPPFVHDFIEQWLPEARSVLIIQDDSAGYHSFLGADPISAKRFEKLMDEVWCLETPAIDHNIRQQILEPLIDITKPVQFEQSFIHHFFQQPNEKIRFYPELLKEIAKDIHEKIKAGVSPSEIVVLSPFLTDSTVFSLANELSAYDIKLRALRPSIALNDDPVIKALITLAVINHPEWDLPIDPFAIRVVINYLINSFDLVRTDLLFNQVKKIATKNLPEIDALSDEMLNRFEPEQLMDWEKFHTWFKANEKLYPLDVFFSRLFGELLSQPGFAFHDQMDTGKTTARLIASYKKFHAAFDSIDEIADDELDREFVKSIQTGLLGATFVEESEDLDLESVLITPVTSFLSLHQQVDYQYWLNLGSSGWYERLEQPLTHPVVLSRHWKKGKKWSAEDDLKLSKETLIKLISGLFSRCKKGIFLGLSEYDENGNEEKGLLMLHLQSLYRRSKKVEND